MTKVACIIPARLHSTRFPEKLTKHLGKKPILQWVWEAATSCKAFSHVSFAIDHPKIQKIIDSFGGKWEMTREDHPNGTFRMAEILQKGAINADIWVAWQADEPFVTRTMIQNLLSSTHEKDIMAWTLKKKIAKEHIQNPSTVKVVTDQKGKALYFSRSPIPHDRDNLGEVTYYKHIGIYAYRKEMLSIMPTLQMTPLAASENLEQLVLLEHGFPMQVIETKEEVVGIDTPQDLLEAERYLSKAQKKAVLDA